MGFKPTEQQQRAISLRGKNILVSAAAGSGKTQVLVERIISLILGYNEYSGESFDSTDIDKMLIVTFTKAAAAEMKAKIRKAIKKAIATAIEEDDIEKASLLKRQLENLTRAQISTFHSFALNIIKEFFHLIQDLEPGFSIADDMQVRLLKNQAFEQLFEDCFDNYGEDENSKFIEFLDSYTDGRNLDSLENLVMAYHDQLRNLPDYERKLGQLISGLEISKEDFLESEGAGLLFALTKNLALKACENYREAIDLLQSRQLNYFVQDMIVERMERARKIIVGADVKDWDAISKNCIMPTMRFSAKKENELNPAIEKSAYTESNNEIKEEVKLLRENGQSYIKKIAELFAADTSSKKDAAGISLDEQLAEMASLKPMVEFFGELLIEFDRIFQSLKSEEGLIDFNDIEHMAIDLLRNEDVAKVYKEKFDYIFVDEYQDTNLLQEEILLNISRSNNVFMVGDVKQSIYKFRHAEPELFIRKYNDYSAGKKDDAEKIDLNRNFRSDKKILECVNNIFEGVMEGYDGDAKLYCGKLSSLETDDDSPLNHVPILYTIINDSKEAGEDDQLLEDFKKAQIEAMQIAKLIRENLGKEYKDADKNIKKIRKKDIVILVRAMRGFGTEIHRVLMNQGLDAYIDNNDGYFDTLEIRVLVNLLRVVDNRRQDVEFLSLLHSEIFGFDFEELAKIRASFDRHISYFDCFVKYSKFGEEEELKLKCENVLETIDRWTETFRSNTLSAGIWQILMESNFYLIAGAMPRGNQRQANLQSLVDKAVDFEKREGSLFGFLSYLTALEAKKNLAQGEAKIASEGEDLIRLMTIHKSKGLEFPMVIVAGMGEGKRALSDTPYLHKDIGIALNLVDSNEGKFKKTLMSRIIRTKQSCEEDEELLRILYVALTRPTSLLFAVATSKSSEASSFDECEFAGGSFLDLAPWRGNVTIVKSSDLNLELSAAMTEFENEDASSYEEFDILDDSIYSEGDISTEYENSILDKLEYSYSDNHNFDFAIKSKYSISEINDVAGDFSKLVNLENFDEKPAKIETFVTLELPKFMREEENLTAARRGTIYHGIMEKINLQEAGNLDYLIRACDSFVERGIFTKAEVEAVDLLKIVEFSNSNIGKRMILADQKSMLWREKAFTLQLDYGHMLAQGIIDCYFIEEDEFGKKYIVLVDYKTNRVDKSNLEYSKARLKEAYKTQMEYYAKALQEATGLEVREKYLYLFEGATCVELV